MAEIKDYSVTADDNNSASPNGMPENMAPSGVNNSWRESFARVKRWYEDINATKSTTGSSNAYVLAAARTVTAYAQGDAYMFRANHANTGAATLNIDSVGAVAIVNVTQSALAAGQIQAGGIYLVAYDATNSKFQLVGASATSASGDNIFVFNASPSVTLSNSTAEDSDGGRESSFLFKGLQSGSEESTLVKIIGSHDGSSDDQKGKLQIYTNDGSDGDSPTLQVTIDSAGLCTLVGAASVGGSLTVAGVTQLNSTVTVGANDQGYDVILYGDTASANVTWDTSVDDLILNGAAGLIVPDGQLTLGSTAVTSTGAELNILDGVTASTAELNILDGVTSTTAEINILDGVTSTTAELNILDGVTSTTAELNILDGVTSTAAELNYLDITTLGTTQASKAVTTDSNGDVLFPDGDKIKLGTGSDLQIYHDASNSYVEDAGTGVLVLKASQLNINSAGDESMAAFVADGAATLYHNNVAKLATTATGVTVTGDISTVTSINTGQIANRNMVINGGMTVAQRATSASGLGATHGYYTLDRWNFIEPTANGAAAQAGRFTMSQIDDHPNQFSHSLKMDCTTADTSIASTEVLILNQRFEGLDCIRLNKGTADAEQVTVSFYVKGNASATYVCELYDATNNRNNTQAFSVTTDWNRIELTFAADTTGAIAHNTSLGLYLNIWLHGGSDFTGGTFASNTWASVTNANRYAGSRTSFFDSTSRTFFITGVQMEVGATATDFEHKSQSQENTACSRYFQKSYTDVYTGLVGFGIAGAAGAWRERVNFNGYMRAGPTMAYTNLGTGWSATNINSCQSHFTVELSKNTADIRPNFQYTANAEL